MRSNESTATQIPVVALTLEHLQCLEQALTNLFSTSLAFETYAQVIDGQPTSAIWEQYRTGGVRADIERNLEPSEKARQSVEDFRANWKIQAVKVDAKVAQAYQDAPLGSKEFDLRLLELVVIISHDVAALLFENAEGGLKKPSLHYSDPTDSPWVMHHVPVPDLPTLLYHADYMDHEIYPKGVADIVGYWTEYRLYGGVVLFDRGDSGTECNDVFIHPIGEYRIFQPSETQLQQVISFLLSQEPDLQSTIFPLRAEKYARRIDPYVSMSLNIYRNKYERIIPSTPPRRCVIRGDDYPDIVDLYEKLNRQSEPGRRS